MIQLNQVVTIKKYYSGSSQTTSATIIQIFDSKPKRKLLCKYNDTGFNVMIFEDDIIDDEYFKRQKDIVKYSSEKKYCMKEYSTYILRQKNPNFSL